jgi:hypothetical protein
LCAGHPSGQKKNQDEPACRDMPFRYG